MKRFGFVLFLLFGICFMNVNCVGILFDDDGGRSQDNHYALVVDSFSVWLSLDDKQDTFQLRPVDFFDTIAAGRLSFRLNIINWLETNVEQAHHPVSQPSAFSAYASPGPQDIEYPGIEELIITSTEDIRAEDVVVKAGGDLKGLFQCGPHRAPVWRSVSEFFAFARTIREIEDLRFQLTAPLAKGVDQQFIFSFVSPMGDTTMAISPRVVAR